MKQETAQRLLEEVGIIRQPSDLDLLLFFARHRRALLTSDKLASLLGYDAKRIAESLDVLLTAGLLKRTQNPLLPSRLYVFTLPGRDGGWLPSLLKLASTREGRLELIEALPELPRDAESEDLASEKRDRLALVR